MNRFVAAERAPRSVAPHHLVDAAREALCDDSPVGRSFGSKEPFVEKRTDGRARLRLRPPVTVRGDLTVTWQLLPGRACMRPEYAPGAQVEPARALFGDAFDRLGPRRAP